MCCGLGGYCGPITSGALKGYTATPIGIATPPYLSEHGSIAYAARMDYEHGPGLSALEFTASREPTYVPHHSTYQKTPAPMAYAGPVSLPQAAYSPSSTKNDDVSLPERLAIEEGYTTGRLLQAFGDYSIYSRWKTQMSIMNTIDAGNFSVAGSMLSAPAPIYLQTEENAADNSGALAEKRTRLENDIERLRAAGMREVLHVN